MLSKIRAKIGEPAIKILSVVVVFTMIATVFAAVVGGAPATNETKVMGGFTGGPSIVHVNDSTPTQCSPDQHVLVLEVNIYNALGAADIMNAMTVTYSGSDVGDVTVAHLWLDDGDGIPELTSDDGPALETVAAAGNAFTFNNNQVLPQTSWTRFWVSFQLSGATIGNTVDAFLDNNAIFLNAQGVNAIVMDPLGEATVASALFTPHSIFGWVKTEAGATLGAGIDVTVTNQRTGESVMDTTDAQGRYIQNAANFPSGYQDNDPIMVTITSPSNGYNKTNLIAANLNLPINVSVDSTAPTIGATTASPLFINNMGTWGGSAGPVSIFTSATDPYLISGSLGLRNEDTGFQPNDTFYVTYNFTTPAANWDWNGSWYFVDGELITLGFSPTFGTDGIVFGEVNGASNAGDVLGYIMAPEYAIYDFSGGLWTFYDSGDTLWLDDDVQIFPGGPDNFRPYRYDGGVGYVAGNLHNNPPTMVMSAPPIVDGRYTVVAGAMDGSQNSAWTNEADGNPIITVDNFPPAVTATGPTYSTAQTFDVNYTATDPAPSSGIGQITLYWSNDGGNTWAVYGTDADLTSPISVTVPADGTYDFCFVGMDMTNNTEAAPTVPADSELTILVDSTDPVIAATTANPLYINTVGGSGTAPPVTIWTNVTDDNILSSSIGIRNEDLPLANDTYFVAYNFTTVAGTWNWDGSWYFIGGELVTASFSPAYGADVIINGEVNGPNNPGDVLGKVMSSHYATWNGVAWSFYDTMGTIDMGDDALVFPGGPDTFKPYIYDGELGYIVGNTYSNPPTMVLNKVPIVDGRYEVVVAAMDVLGNTAWTNASADGNPIITVDNFDPTATATGPASSTAWNFDVTYNINDPAPSSGIDVVDLYYTTDGGATWNYYGSDVDTTSPMSVVLLADGNYGWFFAATDMAQNTETAPVNGVDVPEATTLVDTTNPTVEAGSDELRNAPFVTVGAGRALDASASDGGSGINTIQWTQEAGPGVIVFTSPNNVNTLISTATDGVYTIRLNVTDNLGNWAYDEFTLTWDTTDPEWLIDVTLSNDVNTNGRIDSGDDIDITVTVTDANIDGGAGAISLDIDEIVGGGHSESAVAMATGDGGVTWTGTHTVLGDPFTHADINVTVADLVPNTNVQNGNASYEIAGDYTVNYDQGWNLISIPVLDPWYAGTTPLASANDLAILGASEVSMWNAGTQQYEDFIAGFHNAGDPENFAIAPDMGVFVWFSAAGSFDVNGYNAGVRNVTLVAGWNVVGYMGTTDTANGVGTEWAPQVSNGATDDIAYYATGTDTFVHYHFAGDVMDLTAGMAYFVWSDVATSLTYSP